MIQHFRKTLITFTDSLRKHLFLLAVRRNVVSPRETSPAAKSEEKRCFLWGVISANINFQILLCHSPIMLFSFLRNFFYAVSNPIIPFRILLFIFLILLCHHEFFYSVSNSVIRFRIMLCSFPILLFDCTVLSCSFESYYFLSNSVILFSNSIMPLWILLFSFQFRYSLSNYVLPNPGLRLLGDGALVTSNKLISRV